MGLLDEILERVSGFDAKEKAALAHEVIAATPHRLWTPNPGSQTEAYLSDADEIGFGGEAGPGKTDLLIGSSLTRHRRSLVLRRTNKEAKRLVDRYEEIIGNRDGLNSAEGVWKLPNGRIIRYGGMEYEHDKQKYKGDPNDLIAWDEVVDFTYTQYRFVNQWNRSVDPAQKCQIIATFNPPTEPVGLWVIEHWGPWLDPKHPNPAKSGEIRWFTTIDGRDTEVDGPGPHEIKGEPLSVRAKSRTFIRGYLSENVALWDTGYDATRAAAPKHLREIYRAGSFEAALADVPGQLIPTAWVRAAQARWTQRPPDGIPMCAMGVDCSGGGDDPLMIAMRYDGWYAPLVEIRGSQLSSERLGAESAAAVFSYRRDQATVVVDLGGGYGGPLYEKLTENKIETKGYKGAEKSMRRTRDRKLGFTNKRTEAYWQFREALDPDQPGGSPIALPPDSYLVADLTSPVFEVTPRGIALETKEDLVERLGRSTDRGDAVVMAWSEGMNYNGSTLLMSGLRRGKLPQVVTTGGNSLSSRIRRNSGGHAS